MEIKKLAKNTMILASPKVLKFAIGIIRTKFVAVYLGTTGMGIINQLFDIIGRITMVTVSDLPHGMVKLIAQENSYKINISKITSIIKTYLMMVIPLTLLITILGYCFSNEITIYVFGDIKYKLYFLIGYAALPITILTATFRALLKSFKDIKSLAKVQISIMLINVLLFIPLIYFFKITGGVIYVTLSFFVAFFVSYSITKRNVFKKYNISIKGIKNALVVRKYFKELIAFMGVGIIGGTFFVFTEVTIRSIVVNNLGIDKLGVYMPILIWAKLFVGFIVPSMYTYLYPRLSEARSNKEIVTVLNDVFRLITFITLPFVIIGISTREWIIPLFYSKDFSEASIYLPYHFASLMFIIWTSIFGQIFAPSGRLKAQLIFGIIINLISLALVYFLVPKIGLYGYLTKFTIIPIISLVMYSIFWNRQIKFKIKKENYAIIFYSILCSIFLVLMKDIKILLQLSSVVLIASLYFLLKKEEKSFLLRKIKEIYNKVI